MGNIGHELSILVASIQFNLHTVFSLLAIFWIVHIANVALNYRLNILGIIPRQPFSLPGIFFSPFLHGNFNHLLFNSIPLFLLLNFMLLNGIDYFIINSALIIFVSGSLVWCLGRPAIHIGASSLIMGYWGFLIIDAVLQPSLTTILLVLVCFYYFGGFISSLLPLEEKTSWEGHFFGLISGLAVNYLGLINLIAPQNIPT